jgi:hypothetical protein
MLQPQTVAARTGKPFASQIADSLLLCDLETGDLLSLNTTARAIWEAIAEPATIATICEVLQRRFSVDEAECLRDVTAALSEFERRGFVRLTAAADAADTPKAAIDRNALSV